ncbi:hypothetical protein GCK32_018245 [Trichostrongylus colubriformis]|uniref:Uncharacterized protein n=1 Tax=Trichostrongylus colubriformis TaxID=6319 RepID=A0AAN8F2W3_TRICO
MTARVKDYFLGLPENVQGVSEWKNDEAKIYTPNLVFTYRVYNKRVDGDGIPLSTFFHCD